jgi:putative MATE family efflux protein
MFDRKSLIKLLIPLIIEQLLGILVGMVDGVMVSAVSEAAMSGVNLVDQINVLLINLMTALATGGSVIVAQLLGSRKQKEACEAANQLLIIVILVTVGLGALAIAGNYFILHLIFGNVSAQIMRNARTYFYITALSFPFLGVYNACAALFRSMGNARVSMNISLLMNGINIVGNAICIYGIGMGVEGVAIPTLVARFVAAVVPTCMLFNQKLELHFTKPFSFRLKKHVVGKILGIGVPNAVENSMFQLGKLVVQRWVTRFGDYAIAANTAAGAIVNFQWMIPNAIGVSFLTIVGQCAGAGKLEEAKKHIGKLMVISKVSMLVVNTIMICTRYQVIGIYSNLSPETITATATIIVMHGVFSFLFWTESFALPNAFRAVGDVKFPMIVSVSSMWIFRIGMSYILGIVLDMGLIGIWLAMFLDWGVRGIFFVYRYLKGKWCIHYEEIRKAP